MPLRLLIRSTDAAVDISETDQTAQFAEAGGAYIYTPGFPTFAVSGYFTSSIDQIYIQRDYHTLSWSYDFSWIAGKHTIQMRMDGIRTFQYDNNLSRTDGSFAFDGSQSGDRFSKAVEDSRHKKAKKLLKRGIGERPSVEGCKRAPWAY